MNEDIDLVSFADTVKKGVIMKLGEKRLPVYKPLRLLPESYKFTIKDLKPEEK